MAAAPVRMYKVVREALARTTVHVAEPVAMRGPRDVWRWAESQGMAELPVEEFRVLLLDSQHRMFADMLVSRGVLNTTLVHPREVFAAAIHQRCAAIVLLHNHPSGDPTPSADDRAVTTQLVAAGRILDMPVHDHIIVARGRFTSFAEAGML